MFFKVAGEVPAARNLAKSIAEKGEQSADRYQGRPAELSDNGLKHS
jgi:hypothetical protein